MTISQTNFIMYTNFIIYQIHMPFIIKLLFGSYKAYVPLLHEPNVGKPKMKIREQKL